MAVVDAHDFWSSPRAPDFFDRFDGRKEVMYRFDNQNLFRTLTWVMLNQIQPRQADISLLQAVANGRAKRQLFDRAINLPTDLTL